MTVEELINAAKNGNADAAYTIAQMLAEREDVDSYDQAMPWYEMAAEAGSRPAVTKLLALHKGKIAFNKACADWEKVREHVNAMTVWLKAAVEMDNEQGEKDEFVGECIEYINYIMGYDSYLQGDLEKALHFLGNVDEMPSPMMYILMGCCFHRLVRSLEITEGAIAEAERKNLLLLEDKLQEFLTIVDQRDGADLRLLFTGILDLAEMLRMAPFNNAKRAYEVVSQASEGMPDKGYQAKLREEMTRYQQSFWSGWKYLG